jgi:hypothetical protein
VYKINILLFASDVHELLRFAHSVARKIVENVPAADDGEESSSSTMVKGMPASAGATLWLYQLQTQVGTAGQAN